MHFYFMHVDFLLFNRQARHCQIKNGVLHIKSEAINNTLLEKGQENHWMAKSGGTEAPQPPNDAVPDTRL